MTSKFEYGYLGHLRGSEVVAEHELSMLELPPIGEYDESQTVGSYEPQEQ